MMDWTDLLLFGPPLTIGLGGCVVGWLSVRHDRRVAPPPARAAVLGGTFPHRSRRQARPSAVAALSNRTHTAAP